MALQATTTDDQGATGTLDLAQARTQSALADLRPALPMQFTFRWRNRHIIARIVERDERPMLRLVTDLGVVPFSAEDADRRHSLLSLTRPSNTPPLGHYAVTDRQRLMYCAEKALPDQVTGSVVVANVATTLLAARPYLSPTAAL